jgi:hypothetical protein
MKSPATVIGKSAAAVSKIEFVDVVEEDIRSAAAKIMRPSFAARQENEMLSGGSETESSERAVEPAPKHFGHTLPFWAARSTN